MHPCCHQANREIPRQHGVAEKLQQLARGILPVGPDRPWDETGDQQTAGLTDLEIEKVNAWRALRQASWAGAFFLCTTDILGPFNAPYAFRQNGYVPGTLLYVFMGGVAFYCGGLLWWLYVKLDRCVGLLYQMDRRRKLTTQSPLAAIDFP